MTVGSPQVDFAVPLGLVGGYVAGRVQSPALDRSLPGRLRRRSRDGVGWTCHLCGGGVAKRRGGIFLGLGVMAAGWGCVAGSAFQNLIHPGDLDLARYRGRDRVTAYRLQPRPAPLADADRVRGCFHALCAREPWGMDRHSG